MLQNVLLPVYTCTCLKGLECRGSDYLKVQWISAECIYSVRNQLGRFFARPVNSLNLADLNLLSQKRCPNQSSSCCCSFSPACEPIILFTGPLLIGSLNHVTLRWQVGLLVSACSVLFRENIFFIALCWITFTHFVVELRRSWLYAVLCAV